MRHNRISQAPSFPPPSTLGQFLDKLTPPKNVVDELLAFRIKQRINQEKEQHRRPSPMTQRCTPSDPTSAVLRSRGDDALDSFISDEASAFLHDHLHESTTFSPLLLPDTRVAMVYGREGSGKTSLVNHVIRGSGSDIGQVFDFRIQRWNLADFTGWVALRLKDMDDMHRAETDITPHPLPTPKRLSLIIGSLHRFNSMNNSEDAFNTLLHLLTRVRASQPGVDVKVVLTCDESPGQFPAELLSLIDKKYLLVPPSPKARSEMILELMQCFRSRTPKAPGFDHLGWDIELAASVVDEDPTHIVHTLVVASSGCTPREILNFMRRTFAGCSRPKESGATVYNAAWIEALLYKIEGGNVCIIPTNPVPLNEACFKYAGFEVQDTLQLGTNNKTCFVRDAPLVFNSAALDNAASEAVVVDDDGEPDGFGAAEDLLLGSAKRPRVALQPATVADALQARLTQQGASLSSAARTAKRIKGSNRGE
jgi:hypothetical protein